LARIVPKSERSLIMTELAGRRRGKNKTIPEPGMPVFTSRNQGEARIVYDFDAAVFEQNMKGKWRL